MKNITFEGIILQYSEEKNIYMYMYYIKFLEQKLPIEFIKLNKIDHYFKCYSCKHGEKLPY